jgi:SAM-dependent methyltransferase
MTSGMDSASWDRRYEGRELVWTAEPNRFLVAETETLAPGRAIDLACGEGRNAIWLAEHGWQAVGADFSEVGLRKARELANRRGVNVDWVAADLLDYRPDPRAFDLVLVFYLQVSAAERRPILQAAAEAVAPGGTFLLVAHDSTNLEHGHGGPQDPAVLYAARDVVTDIEGRGLQIERAERVERPVQTPDGKRIALDALVRARRPD